MKIILRADVDNLGRLGDIAEVKAGYGRNYLLPQGLAMLATTANLKKFELERKKLQKKIDGIRFEAQELADTINEAAISIEVRVGENDKLYGSVTSTHLAEKLAENNIIVDKRKIIFAEPIRALGNYTFEVKLHPDVQAELKVAVIKHGSESDA